MNFRRRSGEEPIFDVRISAETVAASLAAIITLLVLAGAAGVVATYYFGQLSDSCDCSTWTPK